MSETLQKPGVTLIGGAKAAVASSPWSSRIEALWSDPGFRLEWANDLRYHLARSVLELRRYRGLTQAALAKRAGTTQPKIAEVEAGGANTTVDYIVRLTAALEGRIRFHLEPAELETPVFPRWWEIAGSLPEGADWGSHRIQLTFNQQVPVIVAAWGPSALFGNDERPQETFSVTMASGVDEEPDGSA